MLVIRAAGTPQAPVTIPAKVPPMPVVPQMPVIIEAKAPPTPVITPATAPKIATIIAVIETGSAILVPYQATGQYEARIGKALAILTRKLERTPPAAQPLPAQIDVTLETAAKRTASHTGALIAAHTRFKQAVHRPIFPP
jgi:hypothetical protein